MKRRNFLELAGLGATVSAASLFASESNSTGFQGTHFAPRAKRVIYLFMAGGPSQIDLFDHKPAMQNLFDKDLPASIRMDNASPT